MKLTVMGEETKDSIKSRLDYLMKAQDWVDLYDSDETIVKQPTIRRTLLR